MTDLSRHQSKRDFTRTQEPAGKVKKRSGKKGEWFGYLEKHAATRLHYWRFPPGTDGVLKSWAVTRGPSLSTPPTSVWPSRWQRTIRSTMAASMFHSDGPVRRRQVMLWDRGNWEPVGDPHEGLKAGKLVFKLHGERLSGEWTLVRMHGRPSGPWK